MTLDHLTDPQGIKATVNAIYDGGRQHPLANLARIIDGAISDAQFQGLAQFDVARWVAHVITEDQKLRLAEFDKTAPHGKLVANPSMAKPVGGIVPDSYLANLPVFDLSKEAIAEVLAPNPGPAARAIIQEMGPGEFQRLKDKHLTPPTTEAPTKSATTPDPKLSPEALGMIQQAPRPGLWDFLKDLPTLPPVKTGDQPSMFEAFKAGKLTYGEVPEMPPFPKMAFDLIPAMPEEIKASLDAAAEQLREGMEQAAKHVREKITAAQTEAARKLLAEQPHEHIYGRGSNGICRICGHESNSRRARAKRRAIHNEQAKAARQYPQHQRGETVTASSIGPDGARITKRGTVLNPADHTGMVGVVWEDQEPGTHSAVHVLSLSAPASRLHEALKAKGDGGE
ncbi:hypothetical protein HYQ19_gp059 [Arthrobacter phage DrYang]|uniref:Uncharacterized protein n=1 Tax=Arthrobacter phage DrYang TaxID=2686080 RepID=A0A6B9J8F7_9CAUD|nr:hypothetical protein HYQ19_gp059 [Arthrobacter phage DrYang]QGZ17158.1 hypothetical protein SEA_DRYANG_59 [Arthrobacter phage DrYang]